VGEETCEGPLYSNGSYPLAVYQPLVARTNPMVVCKIQRLSGGE
jgi:hypothetical protein